MGKEIVFDYSKTAGFISEEEMKNMKSIVMGAKDVLTAKSGAGNDYLGWIDLPVDYDKEEFARIKKAAEKIQNDSDVLLVIGIGGSYLGARAAIEFLSHSFYNVLPKGKRKLRRSISWETASAANTSMIFRMCWKEKISPLILYPSPVRQQNRRSHSAYSRKC